MLFLLIFPSVPVCNLVLNRESFREATRSVNLAQISAGELKSLVNFNQYILSTNSRVSKISPRDSNDSTSSAGMTDKDDEISSCSDPENAVRSIKQRETPLTRRAFFSWQDNGQNSSEKLPAPALRALDTAVSYLNKLGFTEEVLEGVLYDGAREVTAEKLDVSVCDEGCQDKALYMQGLFKKYGQNLLSDTDVLVRLPKHVKFFFTLCILAERHGSVRWGKDSFLACHMPERSTVLLEMDRFPRLKSNGTKLDPAHPLSFLSKLYFMLSYMTKTEIYKEDFKLLDLKLKMLDGLPIPVIKHVDSASNMFRTILRERLPVVLLLTHMFRPVQRQTDPTLTSEISVEALYEMYPYPETSHNDTGQQEFQKLFIEVCTYNLSQDQRKILLDALKNLKNLENMVLSMAQAVDSTDNPADFKTSNLTLRLTSGKFGISALRRIFSSNEQSMGVRHIFLDRQSEMERKLSLNNASKAEGCIEAPVRRKKV